MSATRVAFAAMVMSAGCSGQSDVRGDGSGAGTKGAEASGADGGTSSSVSQGGSIGMSSSGGSGTSMRGQSGKAGSATLGDPSGGTGGAVASGGAGGGSGLRLGARGGQDTGGGLGAQGGQSAGAGGGSVSGSAGAGAGVPSAAGTATGGTSSDVPPSDLPPADWDTLKLVLTGTNPACTASTCHGNAGGKGGFGFPVKNDAQLYTELTTHIVKDCGNIPIVTPSAPEKSALLMVLRGPCSADLERMPRGCSDADGTCIPPEYIAALEQWIAEGAAHP